MTRKPTHPIRRLVADVLGQSFGSSIPGRAQAELEVARHVEPLLAALEHATYRHVKAGVKFEACECKACRLLAAWRAPL